MNNLKVGDFLFRVEDGVTSIAVVTEYYSKHDYHTFRVIDSRGGSHTFPIDLWEVEEYEWRLLDMSMLSSES